jgi:hypothetical protein
MIGGSRSKTRSNPEGVNEPSPGAEALGSYALDTSPVGGDTSRIRTLDQISHRVFLTTQTRQKFLGQEFLAVLGAEH